MQTYRVTAKGVKAAVAAGVLATVAYGYASGPPAGRTGAPGEQTCIVCHTGTLNSGPGSVTIEGVPEQYEPGQEYTLTVKVSHPNRRRWGFQITALDGSNEPAGELTPANRALTKVATGTGSLQGRRYVEHTTAGTFQGQSQGAQWEVRWTAPPTDVGRVTFYAAGNAANGNNNSNGDNIYTTAVSSGTASPAIIQPVYKKGKIYLQANSSNIEQGAVLEVTPDGQETAETFPLKKNKAGTKWLVKKSSRSTPSDLRVDDVLPTGASVTLVVRNPDGTASAPATLDR